MFKAASISYSIQWLLSIASLEFDRQTFWRLLNSSIGVTAMICVRSRSVVIVNSFGSILMSCTSIQSTIFVAFSIAIMSNKLVNCEKNNTRSLFCFSFVRRLSNIFNFAEIKYRLILIGAHPFPDNSLNSKSYKKYSIQSSFLKLCEQGSIIFLFLSSCLEPASQPLIWRLHQTKNTGVFKDVT